jgi:hypothetical protein
VATREQVFSVIKQPSKQSTGVLGKAENKTLTHNQSCLMGQIFNSSFLNQGLVNGLCTSQILLQAPHPETF